MVNGVLYTPGDKEALKQALLLLQNEALRKSVGRAAAKTGWDMRWDVKVDELLENIRKIV